MDGTITRVLLGLNAAILVVQPLDVLANSEFGTPYLDARYRYEYVNQDGLPDEAYASTLRTRIGFNTNTFHGLSATLELENTTPLGNIAYNDSINNKTNRPITADPRGTELNQAFVQYDGIPYNSIRLGRQRLTLDNNRFIW